MNDSDRSSNDPKALPDDFGMTVPNIRPSKPPQQTNPADNLDLTTPNIRVSPPNQTSVPPAPDDFGMTMPNINRNQPGNLPPDDFDLTAPNIRRNAPSEPDFGLTMPGGGYGRNQQQAEPDYGATMPYISLPEAERQRERRRQEQTQMPPASPAAPQEKRRAVSGIPLWAWLVTGGLALTAFLAVTVLAFYVFYPWHTGFNLVITGAPAGSTVLIDNVVKGCESSVAEIKCFGLKANEPRKVKITHPGYTEYDNDNVVGTDGKPFPIDASLKMRPITTPTPAPSPSDCDDPDPRVAEAECRALAELDKLVVPFTVDDLVRVLNMHIINFESGKADIPPRRERFLRRAAEKFKQLQGSPVVEIGGHTDNVGGAAANSTLSQDRAKAVRSFYTTLGVNTQMLTTRGYGAAKPKTDNSTEENRFRNRRIEYSVVSR